MIRLECMKGGAVATVRDFTAMDARAAAWAHEALERTGWYDCIVLRRMDHPEPAEPYRPANPVHLPTPATPKP